MLSFNRFHLGMFGSASRHRPGRGETFAAGVILLLLAPLMAAASLAVALTTPGPVLVQTPIVTRDGRLVHVTTFRIHRSFDAETHDRLGPTRHAWLTPIGALLHATRFDRLPMLLDVQSGRVTLTEALLSPP